MYEVLRVLNRFLRALSCRRSPDGSCVLTTSEDNIMRLFELYVCDSQLLCNLSYFTWSQCSRRGVPRQSNRRRCHTTARLALSSAKDRIRRICLRYSMVSFHELFRFTSRPFLSPYYLTPEITPEPEKCCFLATSRAHPVHLWDAFTGMVPTRHFILYLEKKH